MDKLSKKKKSIVDRISKDRRKLLHLERYITTIESRKRAEKHRDSSGTDDDDGDDDSEVSIFYDGLRHANVANTSLREIYTRKAEGKTSQDAATSSRSYTSSNDVIAKIDESPIQKKIKLKNQRGKCNKEYNDLRPIIPSTSVFAKSGVPNESPIQRKIELKAQVESAKDCDEDNDFYSPMASITVASVSGQQAVTSSKDELLSSKVSSASEAIISLGGKTYRLVSNDSDYPSSRSSVFKDVSLLVESEKPVSSDRQNPNSECEISNDLKYSDSPKKHPLKHEKKKKKTNLNPLFNKGETEISKEINLEQSNARFSDIAGLDGILKEIAVSLLHLKKPELYEKIGLKNPPRGLLLHGPSGCGKTLIAHAIAGELQLPLIKVASTEMVSGIKGDSEKNIRELFERATLSAPCILFIDEIDAIASKRDTSQQEFDKRMVVQIIKCMDDLNTKDASAQVMVIGATNRPDSLDPALRRAGRFDREICIGIPDESSRLEILKLVCENLRLEPDFDLHWLSRVTPGYVGADLQAIVREAAIAAINRTFLSLVERENLDTSSDNTCSDKLNVPLPRVLSWLKDKLPFGEEDWGKLFVTKGDFETAIQDYVPSSKREGFATVPSTTWEDVGALKSVKGALQKAILWPLKYKKEFEDFNLSVPSGVLLYGPKGCGKTLLAKAVANECSINFLSVKGPELLNMYVGESERAVRECFQRAKNSAPCVIFFDEIDALCPQRSKGNHSSASDRVVNQLLTEIDGVGGRKQIFVMGATNRPDNIDSAMLRPGRLEQKILVGVPTENDRLEILQTITQNGTKPKLSDDINLIQLANDDRCSGFSGADLRSLVREASFKALEGYISEQTAGTPSAFEIHWKHFEAAFSNIKPSISEVDRCFFKNFS